MINKIYKRIYNKYSNIIKFFLFLRYVFVIFLISVSLFISIPKFFDYEKKKEIIKQHLIEQYNLKLNNFTSIQFDIFPLPNLYIRNADFQIKNQTINFSSKNAKIFLEFKSIYNFKNFKVRKISLNDNKMSLDIDKSNILLNYLKKLNNKLDIKYLNLDLNKNNNSLIDIKNISFSNYGYKKYEFIGELFEKKFKVTLKNNNQDLTFKILDVGIKANFMIIREKLKESFRGISKISLPSSVLKFNFDLNNKKLSISKSNFRNKDLTFSFDSLIKFKPFFHVESIININEIDKNLANKLNLKKLIDNKKIIKKLNGKIDINYENKNYFIDLIESHSSEFKFAYGRLIYSSKFLIFKNEINCRGESVLTADYPKINFVCFLNIINKKKLFKKFDITNNLNSDPINLNIEGSINLVNQKINFKKIIIEDNYIANEEDKKYFNETFNRILYNENFFKIFSKSKIKNFFFEIL